MSPMTSGDFLARTRLSAKALRLYARNGLLAPQYVDPVNRYRYYGEDQIAQARLILMLRGLGAPLATIRSVLALDAAEQVHAIAAYWQEAEAGHAARRELAAYVISVVEPERILIMTVQTRPVEEQTYLTERKRVSPAEIPGFIQDSVQRLAVVAERFGGWAGPLTTIYQEPVNDDTDGVVENAVPVRGGIAAGDVEPPTHVLVEPAGEIAFTRITKARVAYPQILQAYDEVYAWLTEEGLTPSAAPREIYFADFMSAGPDDEVCDIAVPFSR